MKIDLEEVFQLARGCCEVKEAVGMEVEVESLSAILKQTKGEAIEEVIMKIIITRVILGRLLSCEAYFFILLFEGLSQCNR